MPEDTVNLKDYQALKRALQCAVGQLGAFMPGDSRVVPNEFVAVAAVSCDCDNAQCWEIIDQWLKDNATP